MSDAHDFGAPTRDQLAPPSAAASAAHSDTLPRSWLGRHARELDGVLFASFATALVLYVALVFYGSMHAQTQGRWSAPLDDVFIHFDYARSIARGYPLEWSEGNGYSSGNTSLTYPFVLAFGYWVGFRELYFMKWAAMVACASVLAFLLGTTRFFDAARLPSWAKYLLPPAVLGLGALDWTLFSGMENAFHLAVWSAFCVPVLGFAREGLDEAGARRLGWLAGLSGAVLFATRPESVACVASSAVFAALLARRRLGPRAAASTVFRIALPGTLTFCAHTAANRLLTGEWAANGAIAKLALNNPYMTAGEKWGEYLHFLKYVVVRNTQHHFADVLPWGWLVPLVALLPLIRRSTRPVASLLWVQVVGWLLLVSFNGQVRWQNERYTMAAVAWLLLLASMGLAVLVDGSLPSRSVDGSLPSRSVDGSLPSRSVTGWRFWLHQGAWQGVARIGIAICIVATFAVHQVPNIRDQIWFFGRASRNILDQHVTAGYELRRMDATRVLVGDAGALMYASDRPGLDLIGLGGYHDYPFARAAVHGLGASLELIERMPREERPDVMAIYPSWWGDVPSVFGQRLLDFPVVGNVICGDSVKVVYRADWGALDRSGRPRSLAADETVVDELDVADLPSERAHRYVFPSPGAGFVEWRVLPDPQSRTHELFDAGRIIPAGRSERLRVRAPRRPGRLVTRTTSAHATTVELRIGGATAGELRIEPTTAWQEFSVDLPAATGELEIELVAREREWTNFHLWVVAK